ncbi:MAG: hypothetical protein WA635_01380 [Gallionella sp.]
MLWIFSVITLFILIIGACTSNTAGKSKVGSKSSELGSSEKAYIGPPYTIGIIMFDSKPSVKESGLGEAATTILQKQFETAGLKTILLDMNELKEAQKSKGILFSKAVKIENEDPNNGIDSLDFRLSGSISAYSEVERVDPTVPHKKIDMAHLTVEYALFDIATGKPLLAESSAGENRKTSTGELGQVARSSSDPKLRDGALRDAVAEVTGKVISRLSSMPFQGKLLAVDDPLLILKAGRRSQLKEGTQLAVYHISEALVDPDNGQVLGYKESKIGVIKIASHHDENLSSATVVSGSGFQVGDLAKPIP